MSCRLYRIFYLLGVETKENNYDSPGENLGKFKIIRCLKGIYGATPDNQYATLLCLDRTQMSFYWNIYDTKTVIKIRMYNTSDVWSPWLEMLTD